MNTYNISDMNKELTNAFSLHQAGKTRDAKEIYQKILAADPEHADALHLLGVVYHQEDRNEKAEELIRRAIRVSPENHFYYLNLASVLQFLDKGEESLACYRKITDLRPDNSDAWYNMANLLKKMGKTDEAIESYQKALALHPDRPEALNSLANTLRNKGEYKEALSCFRKAVEIKPDYARAYSNMGVVLMDLERTEEAVACYEKSLALNPSYAEAYNNLGIALKNQGDILGAVSAYEKALALKPGFAEVYNNLGVCRREQGEKDAAVAAYRKAIEIKPDYIEAHTNMGAVLAAKGDAEGAIACYQKALEINPDHAETYNSMGIAFKGLNRLKEAVSCYEKAVALKPDFPAAFCNLALGLRGLGRTDDAIGCYRKILAFQPDNPDAYASLVHQLQHVCAWEEVQKLLPELDRQTQEALEKGERTSETPFENLTRHPDPSLNMTVAQSWAEAIKKSVENLKADFSSDSRRGDRNKIRIGYLSSDFHNHATAHLILGLFRNHRREEFEIFCYSYGKEDNSFYRQQILKHTDRFADIRYTDFGEAAKQIHDDKIDILVDLKGHTKDNRLEICALRPAPLQLTWLGFPATSGADFFDYIIADKSIVPDVHLPYYTEKCLRLPHCYQINDNEQIISDESFGRRDFGIPEDSFVFSSFNQVYKIEAPLFDIWMRLLRQIPGSVLWLLRGTETAQENLWKEAEIRGVAKERIVFAKAMLKARHLCRIKLSDLCLDPFTVNGHTTTSDALWAGVPVITKEGSHFASRVSASILRAVGLPELITFSPAEYESLAHRLAANPDELEKIRAKLAKNRVTHPLFDTARFTAGLEQAYKEIWQAYLAGKSPRHIDVSEDERDAELGTQESGVRSQESGVRSQESGVRSQESGVRNQESGVRSQESGLGTQDSESVPQSPAPDLSKALAHHQAGQLKAAQEIYQKIIAENPNNSNALHLSGLVSFQRGDYDTAVNLIQKAIDIFPGDPVYYTNLAAVFMSRQKYDHAIFCYENIIRLNPDNADVYINMGSVYKEKGEKEKALSFYQKAIERGPDNPGAYVNLGVMMKSLGRMDEAINCYNNALRLKPDYAEVYYNIGNVLREQGKLAESIHRYEDAIRFKPDYTQAYYNIGNTLRDLKKLQESIAYYQKALELDPGFADACNNMGLAFKEMKNADKAAACYRKALEIRPDYALACFNLGNVFKDQKEFRKSADCFEKALEIKPDYAEACSSLLHQLQHMCEWKRFAELSPGLDRLSDDLLARGKKAGETPFMNLVRHGDPQRNFQVAVSWADDIARNAAKLSISFSHEKYRTEKQGKIIIGYLSNDFRNHPVAHLIAGLFSAHKREDFEIHCYSYGPDDGSYYRKKIEGDCDRFFDIRELSTKDAVKLIYGNHVAILVDLMGYTGETNRLDICALRPAPVQVSFLGFPGTTGADFFDYLITDRIVTPPEHIPFCSESPVYMPHTYQVNDRSQKIAEKTWKRSDFALPENDFIFCSFNQSYKIEPLMFSTWMNILRQFPESVLWLLSGNDVAEKNLKKEAVLRGVHPDRIIFAPRMQKKEHLSRHSLAQLCLDTRIVNGHTTTSDALWAGVPMITLLGSHFASRVSASLLTAAGLPELVTKSLEEYENLALHLARNRDELSRLREKLAENRCKEPLFDTPLFARNLEKAYKEMWQIFKAGEKPRQIDVASLSDEKGKHSEQIFQSLKPEHHKAEPAPGQVKYVSPPRPSAELIKAVQHHQAGRLDQAEEMYRDILRAEPENPDVLHFLGVTAHQKGEHDTAAELMQRALVLFKGNPLYFSNLAAVFQAQGKPEQALASYQEALKVNPAYAEAYYGMAGILTNMERMDGAVLHFQKYLEIKPDNAGAYYGLGNAFYAKGDMENAVGNYEKALALKPDYAEVYNNLGVAYQGMEKSSSAMECYEKALALKPDYAEVYSNMGNLYKYENNAAKAMSAYEKALEMKPDYAEAYNNRGVLFQEQGNIAGALECFEKALALKPDYAEVHNNMGFALKQDDRIGEAVVSYKKALKIKPDYAEVWHNMGNAYQELNDADKAVSCYQKALELKPDYYEVYNNLVLQLQLLCDWPQLEKTAAKLDAVSRESLEKGEKTPELPFANLVRHADPVLNLAVAKSRSAGIAESVKNSRMTFAFEKRKKKKEGIVLGYFSNDFQDHATSHLILRLFENHSREKFMINCYSYGRDDKSPYRKKIQQDCDRFADLREMSHEDAAKKIYDDGVDILIDLKGYTKGNRVAVCAFRPAPVQVSWLGFPGSTGASFFDYIITDRIVSPEKHISCYSEQIVYMPHCYQINDHQQRISEKKFVRADFGLPEQSIVFCSFNQLYKVEPLMFDTWMDILKKVEKSVLWLQDSGETTKRNLKNEARKRDVHPDRIIFSGKLPKAEHLARLQVADICLDTRIVNGHTTTSDALWAGLPVITLKGGHFASRVAASILTALGLPELICESREDYFRLAVRLAENPADLHSVREKVVRNRPVRPLFDTPRFVRNMEKAFEIMWEKYCKGEKPSLICIEEG